MPEAYPKKDASNSCLKAFTMRNMVASCVEELIKTNVVNGADLRIFTQPAVSVFALNNIDEQKLVLVPATQKIFSLEKPDTAAKNVAATAGDMNFILAPCFDKDFINPFWYIKDKSDRTKCNMEIVNKTVYTRLPTSKEKSTNPIFEVSFPTAVNFKAIKKHEECVLYRPAVKHADKKRQQAALVLAGTQKKAKAE